MKTIAALFAFCCLVSCCATGAWAQSGYGTGSYNANGADSRVIYGGNGLSTPSGSYIGAGTMSKSARGINQNGPQINPGLPRTPWGANIGTPGDNQYSENKIGAYQPQPQQGRRGGGLQNLGGAYTTPRLPGSKWGANIGTAGDGIRSDMNPGYYANNQNSQQFVQMEIQRERAAHPTQFQRMVQTSGNGPLRYDTVSGIKPNY